MERAGVVWFRNDLRLHDNENLIDAIHHCDVLYYVYVFDPRVFAGKTKFGFDKTGAHRARFIIESVFDLSKSIEALGAQLIIRVGKPEEVVAQIARETKSSWVFCNRERTHEELVVQDNLEKLLWQSGIEIRYNRGKMLYYTQDLPFPVPHTPETFTAFRKEVEKIVPVRPPLPTPVALKKGAIPVCSDPIPKLSDFNLELPADAISRFKGGESAALAHVHDYFRVKKLAATYKETRNNLLGDDYSTKFSVYLAHGCISPKYIYAELQWFEKNVESNESTYWIFFELLWRDYFRLYAKKYGNKIFQLGGITGNPPYGLKIDYEAFKKWSHGETGIPFIDANMIELRRTGYMSNRGRQNVASFLVKDMKINWLMGAEWFESQLIDYDPASNYGNWNYIAGVGADPREDRYFNILTQAKRYDPDAEFVKFWLPQLQHLPPALAHQPELISSNGHHDLGCKLSDIYIKPIISSKRWVSGHKA